LLLPPLLAQGHNQATAGAAATPSAAGARDQHPAGGAAAGAAAPCAGVQGLGGRSRAGHLVCGCGASSSIFRA
jgi:hypothetical protein